MLKIEQQGEKIHGQINELDRQFANIKNKSKIYKFREYFSSSDERRSCHHCHFKLKKRNNFTCNFSLIKYIINLLHIFVLFDILDL